jgi:hypothetical protein
MDKNNEIFLHTLASKLNLKLLIFFYQTLQYNYLNSVLKEILRTIIKVIISHIVVFQQLRIYAIKRH